MQQDRSGMQQGQQQARAKVLLLTGGAWWSSTPRNLGHQFLLHTLRSAAADTGADGSIPPGAPATSNKRIFPLRIYLCSRTPPPQGQKTLDGLLEANRGEDQIRDEVYHIPLDLASPSSIRSCAAAFDRMETARRGHVDAAERDRATTTTSVGSRLDYLVLNAAIAPGSERRTLPVSRGMEASEEDAQATKEIEESFAVNVLGNALLWQELEPFLSPSEGPSSGQLETSKVVVVSSELHRRCHRGELGLSGDKNAAIVPEDLAVVMGAERWKGMNAYKVGKLVQTIHAYSQRLRYRQEHKPIDVVTVSPGFVPATALARASSWPIRMLMSWILPWMPFATSPEEGGRRIFQAVFEDASPDDDMQDAPDANSGDDDDKAQLFYLKEGKRVRASDEVYNNDVRTAWSTFIAKSSFS